MNPRVKKPVVWQDIRPAKPLGSIAKAPAKKFKFNLLTKINVKNRFLSIYELISNKKIPVLLKRFYKKNKIASIVFLIIMIALAGFLTKTYFIDSRTDPNKITIQDLAAKTPQFKTVLPDNKSAEDLGGWQRVSPPNRSAVFTYIDTINGVKVNVSQQPLPEEFTQNTNSQIELLAKNFKAEQKITIGEIEAYIGTSVDGPQSVIFAKNGLLILMKSTSKIDSELWADYISNLK